MSAAETIKSLPDRPMPNGDPSTWVYLDDLPTPPEVQQEITTSIAGTGRAEPASAGLVSRLVGPMKRKIPLSRRPG